MRKGISIAVTPADRVRLEAIVRDRNSPQKLVWRARIVLPDIPRIPIPLDLIFRPWRFRRNEV